MTTPRIDAAVALRAYLGFAGATALMAPPGRAHAALFRALGHLVPVGRPS